MENYIQLAKETLKTERDKNNIYIEESVKKYRENIVKINQKINQLNQGITDLSYNVVPLIHRNNLLDTYIHGSLEWFGSNGYEAMEESVLSVSNEYNISVYDSLRVLNLADEVMSYNSKLTSYPIIRKILLEKNSERAKNYPTEEELQEYKEKNEKEILFILNKKHISTEDYAKLYIQRLELDRGYSEAYDKFLDWLLNSVEYGVISSFCEFDEYYKYREDFENETINLEDFKENIC